MLQLSCFQNFLILICRQSNLPQHIGFIMDGNRRFAKTKNQQSFKGHQDGKQTLKKYLLYCNQLHIKQTSFFCFSIQNFKRSQIQINKLMEMVLNAFNQLSQFYQIIMNKNIKVNIVGNLALLRQDVRDCFQKVQQNTNQHTGMVVNLCFAYDSLYEVNTAINKAQQQLNKNINNQTKQLTFSQIYQNLSICRPVDILVRTSNQSRLSNFMLMQNSYSLIYIIKQNWPAVNLFTLMKIIMYYNLNYKSIQKKKQIWMNKYMNKNKNKVNNSCRNMQQDQDKQKLL